MQHPPRKPIFCNPGEPKLFPSYLGFWGEMMIFFADSEYHAEIIFSQTQQALVLCVKPPRSLYTTNVEDAVHFFRAKDF
jgi:hypothetical protein